MEKRSLRTSGVRPNEMFGLLNLNKPQGESSRDTVNRIQRMVRPIKVGHCGTLDPMATGVLVVCLGPATRLADYVQQLRKTYVGSFQLGYESDSEDTETELRAVSDASSVSQEELQAALPLFQGTIQQMPPAYSALKVRGKRAYELARKGKKVDLKPREVSIYQLKLVEFAYPHFKLHIECSAGTYIRSLGRDLGRQLGSGAVMTALSRTCIGPFTLDSAKDPRQLNSVQQGDLLPPAWAVQHLHSVLVSPDQIEDLQFGRPLQFDTRDLPDPIVALDESGQLQALMVRKSTGLYQPKINFCAKR